MTAEGAIIITPTQPELERMAEDGADIVRSDPTYMREISERLTAGIAAHIRAYEAQPAIEQEGAL